MNVSLIMVIAQRGPVPTQKDRLSAPVQQVMLTMVKMDVMVGDIYEISES